MSNPVEYLIILTETERKQLVLSLENYMNMYTIHGYKKVHTYRDKTHTKLQSLLVELKTRNGGFKLKIATGLLEVLSDALYWYSGFVPQKKGLHYGDPGYHTYYGTKYTDLGMILLGRCENRDLFDFDPVTYNFKEDKKIPTSVVSESRYLITRYNEQNQVTRLDEFSQYSDETDVEYQTRIDDYIRTANYNYHISTLFTSMPRLTDESFEQYKVRIDLYKSNLDKTNTHFSEPFSKVQFKDLSKLVLSDKMSYFHS